MSCPCNVINIIATGGLVSSGSSDVLSLQMTGGMKSSGTARVINTGTLADGFVFILPLDEAGDDFIDRSANQLDGYVIDSDNSPTLDDGVFCLPSQSFNNDFIHIPNDGINGSFSVSLWIKIDEDESFGEKVFISRGTKIGTTHDFNFSLGTSFINQLMAKLNFGDEVIYVFGDELELDRWYHVSCSFDAGRNISVYINGILSGSTETSETTHVDYLNGNHGYIGRANNGKGFKGNIQEVRMIPYSEDADYFRAEYRNFCSPDFYVIGETDEATTA